MTIPIQVNNTTVLSMSREGDSGKKSILSI